MSNGFKFSLRPAAATETNLYTCPGGKDAVVNIRAINANGTAQAKVRIGVQNAASAFAAADYMYYDYPLFSNLDPLIETGIVLTSGQSIRVYTDTATVNFQAFAAETTAG